MEKVEIVLSKRQAKAWSLLTDKTTNEILYGGAAGGGKSFLGCVWLLNMCVTYPGTRWLMGRAVLKNLKESTLKTFHELVAKMNWQTMIKINELTGVIKFRNGSEIIMKDLFAYPSDPQFDSLGSTEYTGAFIDEASQITLKAKNIVLSRIRYKLVEYNLVPKMLICSNPAKNWMYEDFYKADREGTIPKDKAFVSSLVTDNPYMPKVYQESLNKLDKLSKERLLYGNWEYDDDLGKLFKYDDILDMFTNSFIDPGEKYITCDVARKGSDKCVIFLWNGFRVERAYTYDLSLTSTIKQTILEVAETEGVPRSHIVIDEDGVGGGLVDELPGCQGFVNNSGAKGGENFANLKSQCYFKLAEFVENKEIYFAVQDMEITEKLKQDLEQIKQKDPDKDGKLAVIGKELIKQNIGRSTDYSDALMMRMIFEVGVEEAFFEAASLDCAF